MWLVCYDLFMWHFLISVNMLNKNLNINWFSLLSGLSLISPYDWYSGGRVFNPRSGHISFVEIWSLDNFYDHSLWLVQVGQLLLTGESMGT